MSNYENTEDEIDLRDYINVLLKKKRVIIVFFLVVVVTTAVVTLFMPKVYQATASIMIISPNKQTAVLSKETGEYLQMSQDDSLATHQVLLKSNFVLGRLIDSLRLANGSGNKLTSLDLISSLSIKEIKETNILELQAEGSSPLEIRELVNAWAQEYVKYNQELISGEVKGMGDLISGQFEIAKQNFTKAEEKVKDFKDKNKLDLLKAEVDIKKTNVNDYKKELFALRIAIKTAEDSLRELKKEIEKQDKFIIVSKAITDDALWQKAGSKDAGALNRQKLQSEQINPIYQDLEARIVNKEIELNTLKPKLEYLRESIASTEKEIDKSEKELNQGEFELNKLLRDVEIYKRTYDNLSRKIEDARIAKSMQLGEVKIVSPAIEPRSPIKPKKRHMLAISSIISLMFGVFLAFFMEYWEKSKQTSNINKEV